MTTGLSGLDQVLKGILPGDNIVWQVDTIGDYIAVVAPYYQAGLQSGRKVIYFRFASHPPVIVWDAGVEVHELDPAEGFETFIAKIHAVIEDAGRGALYIFDCMSELAADWYSDQMLGNFFMLTCPFLYDLETVAYFALFRNYHSSRAIRPITETTQLFLELYRRDVTLYVHPLKVQFRYSPTMNMLHAWKGDEFETVTSSILISSILSSVNWSDLNSDTRPGFRKRTFMEAQSLLDAVKAGRCPPPREQATFHHLCRMAISRDPDMLKLVARYFTLEDVLGIWKRMIGSGLIGGKTVGMLVARSILKRHSPRFADLLEEHDSFYIGSDVFYTYLVRNGVWWLRQKQRNPQTFLEGAVQARQRILMGQFPDYLLKQFEQMLDYFGQSPIIVRSSSLLEDNFGNSFAGKYESVFCPNQGPRERRLEDFLSAVRTIYASTMSEKALRYREQRGLLDHDEQMALLVMRVSGAMHGRYYYPQAAGVGFSFNPYVWHESIDPKAGVLRLVFGLGTRAVDRSDDDYTRLVALNAPQRRPECNFEQVRQYAQRRVDYLDLQANRVMSGHFLDVIEDSADVPVEMFASADESVDAGSRTAKKVWVPTFDNLLSTTDFVKDMREILQVLQEAYDYPVDVEFTLNFVDDRSYKIHLVQCRPLPVKGIEASRPPASTVSKADTIIEAGGAVIGHSRHIRIDRFVYVVPSVYSRLPLQDRYEIARLIGRLNNLTESPAPGCTMLLGPGRWGTSDPFLGIPVAFAEINRASVLCEIVAMRENLVPDVSLGTHFLNELVETDMLYLALFPQQGNNYLHTGWFENSPNRLLELLPRADKWAAAIKVIDPPSGPDADSGVFLDADAFSQKVVCYFER
ncbi:MAG: pyruvate, phosphate dikinase [Planctomycetes bacterium RBG_13_62_9]|nr:MAG: pyruvate, phosphate dikinase [Planctomycetes bacterium RBG_13_62_9]